MKSVNVKLNTIDKVKGFVNIISTNNGDFDLASDRYIVDAKSIMGIFSLDLGKTLRLDIHDDSIADKITGELKDYIVE
jgi:phosphotransferase system HPr-like phosphotransfer protein